MEKCLALLTFLPMDEVRRLGALRDSAINEAKAVLAYEVTKLVHGEEAARQAKQAAEALFGGVGSLDNVPTATIGADAIGQKLIDVLVTAAILPSKSEGRRLIAQGGLSIGDTKVTDADLLLTADHFENGSVLIRRGKKQYHRLLIG